MKLLCLFLIAFFTTAAWSRSERQVRLEELQKRVASLSEFLPTYQSIISQTAGLEARVKGFKHPNLLKAEQDRLDQMGLELEVSLKNLGEANSKLFTDHLRKDLQELQEKINERELFLAHKTKREEIEQKVRKNPEGYSKRFVKYMDWLADGKSTQADLLYRVMPKAEKELADMYQLSRVYTIQQDGVQEYLEASINKEIEKISYRLSFPENEVKAALAAQKKTELLAQNLATIEADTALLQFDLEFKEAWEVGMFGCRETNPRVFNKMDHYPYLLMLKNDEGSSIVRLNPENPKSFEILYRCKKTGYFGFCLDNQEKEHCKVIDECRHSLEEMEKSFNSKALFLKHQSALGDLHFQQVSDKFFKTFLPVYEGRELFYSENDLKSIFHEMDQERKKIIATSPEDFQKKLKQVFSQKEKNYQNNLKTKAGYIEASDKARLSQTILKYLFLNLADQVDTMVKPDEIQPFAYEQCKLKPGEDQLFCHSYTEWQSKLSPLKDLTPLRNLLPQEECPKAVFRLAENNKWSEKLCGEEVQLPVKSINPLESDIQKILKSIK